MPAPARRRLLYHQIAGGNLSRLCALTDGVFAIVLTLLVLDLHAPVVEASHGIGPLWSDPSLDAEGELLAALGGLLYWLNLLALGLLLLATLHYARRADLLDLGENPQMPAAFRRRLVVPQALYAVAVLLSAVSTYVSVGLLVLLQLNSALAPNIRPLNRF